MDRQDVAVAPARHERPHQRVARALEASATPSRATPGDRSGRTAAHARVPDWRGEPREAAGSSLVRPGAGRGSRDRCLGGVLPARVAHLPHGGGRYGRAGFGMNRVRTLQGAWYVLRANQVWAPYPDNDPDGGPRADAAVLRAGGRPDGHPHTRPGPGRRARGRVVAACTGRTSTARVTEERRADRGAGRPVRATSTAGPGIAMRTGRRAAGGGDGPVRPLGRSGLRPRRPAACAGAGAAGGVVRRALGRRRTQLGPS